MSGASAKSEIRTDPSGETGVSATSARAFSAIAQMLSKITQAALRPLAEMCRESSEWKSLITVSFFKFIYLTHSISISTLPCQCAMHRIERPLCHTLAVGWHCVVCAAFVRETNE